MTLDIPNAIVQMQNPQDGDRPDEDQRTTGRHYL